MTQTGSLPQRVASESPHWGAPRALTAFIGRLRELADIPSLLRSNRLVTLTGPAGAGKTRLAVEAAEAIAKDVEDVIWVNLSTIADSDGVVSATAAAMGLRESPPLPLIDLILTHLQDARALLVLDNCEHLLQACADLATGLLRRCPSLCVLATSREAFAVDGETIYPVEAMESPPLADVPLTPESVGMYDVVRLFVDRARRYQSGFSITADNAGVVATICRRLDGLPLAIELAAARVRMMSVQEISAGLDRRFQLLTGAPEAETRHRTLHAAVEWSHDLLEEPERVLLRRLGVFAGGFTLESAGAVCADAPIETGDVLPLLTTLYDRSLVTAIATGATTRYALLETVREYALARLEEVSAETETTRARHLAYFLSLAEGGRSALTTPEAFQSLDRLESEHENLDAALAWAEQPGRFEPAARLSVALGPYWQHRGSFAEGRAHLERSAASDELRPDLCREVLLAAADLARRQWDLSASEALASEVLSLTETEPSVVASAEAHLLIGWAGSFTGRHDVARKRFEEALELAQLDAGAMALAHALCGAAQIPFSTGEWQLARPLFERSLTEARVRAHIGLIQDDLYYLCHVYWMQGLDDELLAVAEEGLDLARRLRDPTLRSEFLSFLAAAAIRRGAFEDARGLLDEALAAATRSGSPFPRGYWLTFQAYLARGVGELDDAATYFGQLAEVGTATGAHVPATAAYALAAEVACLRGDLDHATRMAAASAERRRQAGGPLPMAPWAEALVALGRGDLDRAGERCQAALADSLTLEFKPHALEALELLGEIAVRAGSEALGTRLLGAASSTWVLMGWKRPATLERRYEDALREAETALGSEAFTEAFSQGSLQSFDDAVAYARRGRGGRRRPSSGWDSLTPTEREVVRLAAEGLTNPEIATRLFVSRATVKTHLGHVFEKLGVASRAELAAQAARRGNS